MRRALPCLILALVFSACSDRDAVDERARAVPKLVMSGIGEGQPRELLFGNHAIGQIDVDAADVNATVAITVESVRVGDHRDLVGLLPTKVVDRRRAYYVDVRVEHRGGPDTAGLEVPLYLRDRWDGLLGVTSPPLVPSEPFRPCPGPSLPEPFDAGDAADMCLVFLASPGATFDAIVMLGTEVTREAAWTGPVVEKKMRSR